MRFPFVIGSIAFLAFAAPALGQSEHSMVGSTTAAPRQASVDGLESAPLYFFLRANRLDYGVSQLGGRGSWDIDARIGTDEHRLVLKSEGDYVRGKGQAADLQLLYSTPISEFFDFQAGVRQLIVPAARSSFAIGVQGILPGFIET